MTTAQKTIASVLASISMGLVATPTSAAGDCDAAAREMARAQAALSKATRDAIVRADAYARCMSSSGKCNAQKAAYDVALAAKTAALAALKAASAHKAACH